MDDVQIGQMTLTANGLAKIMRLTGETEDQVRKAAEESGFVVETLPKPASTGMYL